MTNPVQGVAAPDAAQIDPASGAKTEQATTNTSQAASAGAADTADVAQTQTLLQMIDNAAAAVPPANQDRVNALRQAIADGSYRIDPNNVARQLAEMERFLGAASPPSND